MTINRATWVDDDGSGTTGTIINNARLQGDVYDKVDQALATLDTKNASQDTSITANGPHTILSANHTDSVAATLVPGDVIAAAASGTPPPRPGALRAWADPAAGTVPGWRPAAWTAVPYAGIDYVGQGGGTWTVEAADV